MELLSIIVGFIGVILTLLGNAYFARRQQENQAITSQRALRLALVTELKSLSLLFEACVKRFEDILETNRKGGKLCGAMSASITEAPVYHAYLSQLGKLTELEIAFVISVYEVILAQDQKARILPGNEPRRDGVYIPPENLAAYKADFAAILPAIAGAIEELEKNSSAPPTQQSEILTSMRQGGITHTQQRP